MQKVTLDVGARYLVKDTNIIDIKAKKAWHYLLNVTREKPTEARIKI